MQTITSEPVVALRLMSIEDIRRLIRVPAIPNHTRFALVRRPDTPLVKPVQFASLAALAAAIHRDRSGAPLQLENAPLQPRNSDTPRDGVSVFTLTEGGDRHRFLGWAWLDGGDRKSLQAALFAIQPRLAA